MGFRTSQVVTLNESVDIKGQGRLEEMIFKGSQVIIRRIHQDSRVDVTLVNDPKMKTYVTVHRDQLSEPSFPVTKGRYYLCGPMTGLPEHNFPAFHEAARRLRDIGYEIVSPAEINYDVPNAIEELKKENSPSLGVELNIVRYHALRRDIAELCTCIGIIRLPDWRGSDGATLEVNLSAELGMEWIDYNDIL